MRYTLPLTKPQKAGVDHALALMKLSGYGLPHHFMQIAEVTVSGRECASSS